MFSKFLNVRTFSALLLLTIVGCAPAKLEVVVFPPPPDEARYEWLETINSENDFRETGAKAIFIEIVSGASEFYFFGPIDVAANIDGRLLVSDLYQQSIKVLDMENKKISDFTSYKFRNNIGIVVDQQGQVYVADAKAVEVLVFSQAGLLLRKIGDKEIFTKPTFLALNEELDRLYVSDAKAHNVKVFSMAGDYLFSFGEKGQKPGELYVPQGLAIDRTGRVFVADSLNARIQVFSADGEYLEGFGERGINPQQFESPKSLSFDSDGHLYVVDSRRTSFRVFETDGTLLLVVGSNEETNHKLGFAIPSAIVVDSFDRVFISDIFGGGRVTVWQYLSAKYRQRAQPE
jgi:sugar lactone lactonase YvrE